MNISKILSRIIIGLILTFVIGVGMVLIMGEIRVIFDYCAGQRQMLMECESPLTTFIDNAFRIVMLAGYPLLFLGLYKALGRLIK